MKYFFRGNLKHTLCKYVCNGWTFFNGILFIKRNTLKGHLAHFHVCQQCHQSFIFILWIGLVAHCKPVSYLVLSPLCTVVKKAIKNITRIITLPSPSFRTRSFSTNSLCLHTDAIINFLASTTILLTFLLLVFMQIMKKKYISVSSSTRLTNYHYPDDDNHQ